LAQSVLQSRFTPRVGRGSVFYVDMADAPPDWKVSCLKTIQTMPHGSCFERGKTSKQDLIWIQDLERDAYISAKFRMGYFEESDKIADSTIPNLVWDVHVLDAGRQFVLDVEAPPKMPATDWGRVGAWAGIAGIAAAVFIYLLSFFLAR